MGYVQSVVLFTLILSLIACDTESNEYRKEAARSSDSLVRETQETYQALKRYALQKQTEFREQAQTQLARYEQDVEKLRANFEKASAEAKQEFKEISEEWNKRTENLKQQLEQIKSTGAEAWQQAEKQINAGMEELRKLYERARSALS